MNNENINLNDISYAEFLEQTLKELITMPVNGIALNAVLSDGAIYTAYHNCSMQNKITISGIVQQDATLDFLKANEYISDAQEEDANGEEED